MGGVGQRQARGGGDAADLGIDDAGNGEDGEHGGGADELDARGGIGEHEHGKCDEDGECEPREVGESPHADGQGVDGLELAAQAQLAHRDEDPHNEQRGSRGVEHEGEQPAGVGVVEDDHDHGERHGQRDGVGGHALRVGLGKELGGLAAGGERVHHARGRVNLRVEGRQ